MRTAPTPSEMFSDATSPAEVANRFEDYKSAWRDVEHQAETEPGTYFKGVGIVRDPSAKLAAVDTAMANITKGMSAEQLGGLQTDLAQIQAVKADLAKDWQAAAYNSRSGLMLYNLEAPSKKIVPKRTPIRNRTPRNNTGVGGSHEFRRILGWSNSRSGGVPDLMAGFNSETTTNTFGGVTGLRRPQKISYATDSKMVAFVEQGLSDSVTHKAQYQSRGFESILSLSQTALLWATMGAEERAMLYARGASANGFAGAVVAPVISQSSAATGGTITAATYYIKVTANAGGGETVVSNEVNTGALSGSTNTITVNVTTEPTGALNYNLYVGTASNGETLQTSFVGNSFTLTSYTASATNPPGADTTVSSGGTLYDGYLTVLTDPAQSGYVKRVNAKLSTSNPGDEFQQAFIALYGANVVGVGDKRLADPNVVWLDGAVRKEMSDLLKNNASTTSYRIELQQGAGGTSIGSLVSGIVNEITGNMVDLEVHPYMPSGSAVIHSDTLPEADTEISRTVEVVNVQDYMAYKWPDIQMTYDQSTYQYGTLVFYAPAWSGALLGIQ